MEALDGTKFSRHCKIGPQRPKKSQTLSDERATEYRTVTDVRRGAPPRTHSRDLAATLPTPAEEGATAFPTSDNPSETGKT
jgi:hypothetical protein